MENSQARGARSGTKQHQRNGVMISTSSIRITAVMFISASIIITITSINGCRVGCCMAGQHTRSAQTKDCLVWVSGAYAYDPGDPTPWN